MRQHRNLAALLVALIGVAFVAAGCTEDLGRSEPLDC